MNYNKSILKIFLSITFILLLSKCYFNPSGGSIEYFKKELKVKNPTVYIFNKSLDEIKKVIEKELFIYNHTGGLFWKKDYPIYKELFNDSSNFNDYIKVRFKSDSKNYFSKKDTIPLLYFADFHLHLIKIDTNSTVIQVITYKPKILTGHDTFGFIGEIGGADFESVEPTSIEEYEILLKIGEAIGVKDKMPPLLLPE